MMILTPIEPPINTTVDITGWKDDTALGYVIEKYAKKIGYISPRVLFKTRNVTTVMDL